MGFKRVVVFASLTFAAFCAVCSSIYVVNDLFDLASDRSHPNKRRRPLAAGDLQLAPSGDGVGIAVARWFYAGSTGGLVCVGGNRDVCRGERGLHELVEAFAGIRRVHLAGLYTLRIVAGALAVGVPLSAWLAAFSVLPSESRATQSGRPTLIVWRPIGYRPDAATADAMPDLSNGFGVGQRSPLVWCWRFMWRATRSVRWRGDPLWLWGLVAVVLLWLARMWRMATAGFDGRRSSAVRTRDTVSWGCALAVGYASCWRCRPV